jgi:release factor glutamine methyltransferase
VRDHEPRQALDGGPDGLSAIRSIVAGALEALAPGGLLLMEHHHDQSEAVGELLRAAGLERPGVHTDLEGRARFASAWRPGER